MPDNRILLVRHGPGLSRTDYYLRAVLDYVDEYEPALAQRILIHETGSVPPSLDGIVSVLFLLGDPLRERYPSCYAEAVRIASDARRRGIRIVNAPEALSNTIKSVQSRIWREAGLVTPDYRRFERYEELRELAKCVEFPVIVRSDDEHAGAGLRIFRDPGEIDAVDPAVLVLPGAITTLFDVRKGYPRGDSRSRYYHKKRILVMNGTFRTKHLMFSEGPIVGSKTSIFKRYQSRHTALHRLALLHPWHRACIRADLDYWRMETEHEELMLRAMQALGLEFAAIDYSDLADGSVMLWEANPFPHIPRLDHLPMPHVRKMAERVTSYHAAIARFLAAEF